jgi:predicted amidohydrolase YtcJ
VWTGDAARPWADAVAISGGRISAVGSSADVRKSISRHTRVIDAQGGLLCPGFIDSHIHFVEGGIRLSSVQLAGADSRDEFRSRVAAFARTLPPGEWMVGGDWDHELWGGELPSRDWIDDVTAANPLWVTRHDGHMALANTMALRASGIDDETPNQPGGTIVRDSRGKATGVIKDRSMDLVLRVIPPVSAEREDRALEAAMRHVARHGVTSVHNMGTWENLAIFRRAHERGALRTRIYAAVPLRTWPRLRDEIAARGSGDEWLRIGALKEFVDGSLGSHTALFFDEYNDLPGERGLLLTPVEELRRLFIDADSAGLHCVTHAIGDHANRLLLDLYADVAARNGPRDRRFRIEHAQHLTRADIPRFAAQKVIASVQPWHAIDDGRWAERATGHERAQTTYAFRSLLDAGATVAMGSDWFVAPPVPLAGIDAAVNRRTIDGANPGGWIPREKISVQQALHGYTVAAAYAGFSEGDNGSIAPGMLADLALVDRDITAIPADEIPGAEIVATICGGEVIFGKE